MPDLGDLVAAYLLRLGLPRDLPPTVDTLVALQCRHLDAVPYENLSTMLGRPPSVAPTDCLARVVEVGRAGYCFHHNGALELVLGRLGFSVGRRHGHVWTDPDSRRSAGLNHLALVVDGLPTEAHPDGRWWVDTGLGDGFREPLPVRAGVFEQGPFRYQITGVSAEGWSFRPLSAGSFSGIEIGGGAIDQPAVAAAHATLSTPPDGTFTRLVVVQRRGADGTETVRGCLRTRVDADGRHETELTTYDAWRSAIVDGLGLPVADLDDSELRGLYAEQWARHQQWIRAGRR